MLLALLLTFTSLLPLMGFAYFLQFLDKLALSQATLFNLREDLVATSINAAEMELTQTEHARLAILLDIGYLLSWLSILELPEFLCDRPAANWEVPGYVGVSLRGLRLSNG